MLKTQRDAVEKETVQVSTLRIGAGAADGPRQPASGLASARVPSLSPLTPPSPLWSSLQCGFEDQLGAKGMAVERFGGGAGGENAWTRRLPPISAEQLRVLSVFLGQSTRT